MLLDASRGHELPITACGADKLDKATASFEGRATGKSHVSRVSTRPCLASLAEAAEGEGEGRADDPWRAWLGPRSDRMIRGAGEHE